MKGLCLSHIFSIASSHKKIIKIKINVERNLIKLFLKNISTHHGLSKYVKILNFLFKILNFYLKIIFNY